MVCFLTLEMEEIHVRFVHLPNFYHCLENYIILPTTLGGKIHSDETAILIMAASGSGLVDGFSFCAILFMVPYRSSTLGYLKKILVFYSSMEKISSRKQILNR